MNVSSLAQTCERYWPETKVFLREMVEINSLSTHRPGIEQMGRRVASQFGPLGFEACYVPHASPVYGSHLVLKKPFQAERPTVALIGHLDTVFSAEEEERNSFHWREEGSRIHGPGTSDIKGGIALIYLLLMALRESSPEVYHSTNWVVLCNACEEVDSDDFGLVCRAHLPAETRACLIFEADGSNDPDRSTLVTQRKGRATFQVDVRGRGAHAGGQHARGANAIVQLCRIVEDLEARTDGEKGLTINVGTIEGGTVLNRVPETARACLEMRSSSVPLFNEAKDYILSRQGPGDLHSRDADRYACEIEVTQLDETPPWPPNAGSDSLFACWEEAGRELGWTVITRTRGGLSDGNVLWDFCPTLDGLGPQGDYEHCSEREPKAGKEQEYVEVSSFVPKTVLNISALLRVLDSAR